MVNKTSVIGIVIILLLLPVCVFSQYEIKALPRWLVSAHFGTMLPQPPIDQFLNGGGVAFYTEFQYRLQYNKPFLAGLYYGETGLSYYELEYVWNTPEGDVNVSEKANTRRLDFGGTVGFYPEINWLLQPYLQGRLGLAVFQSSSILKDDDSGEGIDRISEMTSSVMSYGLDFGIHIVPNIWYLRADVRVGFVANPSVSFMSLDEENAGTSGYPIDYYETHISSGRWLKITAGISYLF